MFKGVCERVCAPAGAGVTGAGLSPAPVTSQRQASHEVVSTLEARTVAMCVGLERAAKRWL